MTATKVRVERYSEFDGSGAGLEAGPTRLTGHRMDVLRDEILAFEEETKALLSPNFRPIINGTYFILEDNQILMVATFREVGP